jgi:hypothetical protein
VRDIPIPSVDRNVHSLLKSSILPRNFIACFSYIS